MCVDAVPLSGIGSHTVRRIDGTYCTCVPAVLSSFGPNLVPPVNHEMPVPVALNVGAALKAR